MQEEVVVQEEVAAQEEVVTQEEVVAHKEVAAQEEESVAWLGRQTLPTTRRWMDITSVVNDDPQSR